MNFWCTDLASHSPPLTTNVELILPQHAFITRYCMGVFPVLVAEIQLAAQSPGTQTKKPKKSFAEDLSHHPALCFTRVGNVQGNAASSPPMELLKIPSNKNKS